MPDIRITIYNAMSIRLSISVCPETSDEARYPCFLIRDSIFIILHHALTNGHPLPKGFRAL